MNTRSVSLITLGCVRNEVDSEELAGRLIRAGWQLVEDPAAADVAVVNTCGFIEAAKKDSVDVLLDVADLRDDAGARTKAVVAVGCLAQRYGSELAEQLPEADAVLGFDSYADLSEHLDGILHGRVPAPHVPRDRRSLLPVAPAARQAAARSVALPGHEGVLGEHPQVGRAPASGPPIVRARLNEAPWAPLKLASGCDRRCTFCAIPSFRGAFVSRPPAQVLAEARWLAERGVRELFLVSENTTSYGKDLGDLRALETLLPQLAQVDGIDRVRVSYLQPAEVRPGLLEAIAGTPGVAAYFDLSFQHAAPGVLRRMRRFGSTEAFWELLARVRALAPTAGVRSNVIVGFPGESEDDVVELERFLSGADLDVVGVFGYSDEDGTAAADLDGKLPAEVIAERVERVTSLVDELVAQRAAQRIGELTDLLVEEVDERAAVGRTPAQGPDVDGTTSVPAGPGRLLATGDLAAVRIVGSDGADLLAEVVQ